MYWGDFYSIKTGKNGKKVITHKTADQIVVQYYNIPAASEIKTRWKLNNRSSFLLRYSALGFDERDFVETEVSLPSTHLATFYYQGGKDLSPTIQMYGWHVYDPTPQ